MKKMKRTILILASAVLALLLLASCGKGADETTAPEDVPVEPKFTEGLVYTNDELGGWAITGYKGSDTDVIIPHVYEGLKVTSVGNSAFAGNEKITSVTLGENIKVVEVAAFVGCENLVEVNLTSSLEKIGSAAFFGCTKLKTISLPSTVKQIGLDSFAACPAVETVNYDGNQSMWSRISVGPNNDIFDTKLVLAEGGSMVKLIDKGECNANISWRLGYDEILYITGEGHIPDYAFDKVPWGKYAENISSVVVEEGIDIIGKNAFIGCYNLGSVTIAPSVRLIDDGAFYGCKALGNVELPANLRRIGESAFFGCESMTAVEIPESVTAIGAGAFMGCTSLKTVNIPSAVSVIEKWTFANCSSIESIDITGVESVGTNSFFGCTSLISVKVSEKLSEIGANAFLSCPKVFLNGSIAQGAVIGEGNNRIK